MKQSEMLPADDHPQAVAEPRLSTVTDDEFFEALDAPDIVDADGNSVDHTEGVRDER